MDNDSGSLPRSSMAAVLTGGSLAAGGPVTMVLAVLVVASMLRPSASTPPVKLDEARQGQAEGELTPNDEPSTGYENAGATAALRPLWDHLGIDVEKIAKEMPAAVSSSTFSNSSSEEKKPVPLPKLSDFLKNGEVRTAIAKVDAQVVIATLPDPVETGSKYEFDMGLEAIQKALESEAFLIDRFSNPWGRPGAKPGEPGAVASADYRRLPACLVFRSGDEGTSDVRRHNLLVLLIVGESNTWGVHKTAMRTALGSAYRLLSTDAEGRRTIRILGPTYSGTAGSLARMLADFLGTHVDADAWVCSGAATSVEKDQFEKLARPLGAAEKSSRVIYSATVLPDDLVLDTVLEHLNDPAGRRAELGSEKVVPEKTVMLVESGTYFGNRFFRRVEELNQGYNEQNPFLFIPFPRRLAQLRDIPTLNEGIELGSAPKGADEMTLSEKGAVRELFPGFDPEMAQWTDAEVLTHILSTIRGERARNVGVFASEVRNVLFLVRLINRYCPDVQIFLINNDLLFNYRTFAPDFYGAIVASSYPLNSRGQIWSFPHNGHAMRRLLSNELDLGRYNAGLVLLNAERDPAELNRLCLKGQAEDMLVYGPPFVDLEPDPQRTAMVHSRPCVWINLVGKDESWPLRTVSLDGRYRQTCQWRRAFMDADKRWETVRQKLEQGPESGDGSTLGKRLEEAMKAAGKEPADKDETRKTFVKALADSANASKEEALKALAKGIGGSAEAARTRLGMALGRRSEMALLALEAVRKATHPGLAVAHFGGTPTFPPLILPLSIEKMASRDQKRDETLPQEAKEVAADGVGLPALKERAEKDGRSEAEVLLADRDALIIAVRAAKDGEALAKMKDAEAAIAMRECMTRVSLGATFLEFKWLGAVSDWFDVPDGLNRTLYGDYWKAASILHTLRPEFERERQTKDAPVELFERKLTWLGVLSQLDVPQVEAPTLLGYERAALVAAISALTPQVAGGDQAAPRPREGLRRSAGKALRDVLSASLEYASTLQLVLESLPKANSQGTETTEHDPCNLECKETTAEQDLFKRWDECRIKRRILDGAIRSWRDFYKGLDKKDALVCKASGEFVDGIDEAAGDIDGAFSRSLPVSLWAAAWTAAWTPGRVIDEMAEAGRRERQVKDAERLVPGVIDVDREYGEVLVDRLKSERPQLKVDAEGPHGSILANLPWPYYVSIWVWTCLAWGLAARVLRDTRAGLRWREYPAFWIWKLFGCKRVGRFLVRRQRQVDEEPTPVWMGIRGVSMRRKRFFIAVMAVALLMGMALLCRPLLAIVPGARSAHFAVFVTLGLPAAFAWALRERWNRGDKKWSGAILWALAAGAWLVLVIRAWAAVDFGVAAVVATCQLTIVMLVLLVAWAGGLAKPLLAWRENSWKSWAALICRLAVWALVLTPVFLLDLVPFPPFDEGAASGGVRRADLFAATRLPYLGSGVSPLPTVLWLCGLFVLWSINRLGAIASGLRLPVPGAMQWRVGEALNDWPAQSTTWTSDIRRVSDQFDALGVAEREPALTRRGLTGFRAWLKTCSSGLKATTVKVLIGLLTTALLAWFWRSPLSPTPEGRRFDIPLLIALFAYLAVYFNAALRLHQAWCELHKLLRSLEFLPFHAAIGRLPEQVSEAFGRFVGGFWEVEDASHGMLRRIEERYGVAVARSLNPGQEPFEDWRQSAFCTQLKGSMDDQDQPALRTLHEKSFRLAANPKNDHLHEALLWASLPFVIADWESFNPRDVFDRSSKREGGKNRDGATALARGLASPGPTNGRVASSQDGAAAGGTTTATEVHTTSEAAPANHPGAAGEWLELAEDFVLIATIRLLKRYAAPIRSLALFLMISPILLLFAVTAYPFQPQRTLTIVVWTLVLLALALTSWIFIQIDRDPFVSRVSRTTPNAVNFDLSLATKLIPTVVPLVGLIVAAFPDVSFWLRGVLEPIRQALK